VWVRRVDLDELGQVGFERVWSRFILGLWVRQVNGTGRDGLKGETGRVGYFEPLYFFKIQK